MIAHIDLDSFFVAVERARDRGLVGRPVVVGGRPASQGLVAAVSREARRDGVRPGVPLAYAAVRSPDAVFVDGSFDAYLSASLDVDAIVRRESADIEWVSIDEVFVRLQRGGVEAVYRMHERLAGMGLDAGCGLARSKVVARVASRLARPRGVVHVLEGYEARFLAPLKIEMLPGIDATLARRLRAGGVRRLGHLARLTPAQATHLAGRGGPLLARHAAGLDISPVVRSPLPRGPLADQPLPEPTADLDVLRAAVDVRVAHLGYELRTRSTYARSITLSLRYGDGRSDSRTVRLRQPSALTEVLQAAASDLLAQMVRPDRLVRAAGVSCSGLVSDRQGAVTLFPL